MYESIINGESFCITCLREGQFNNSLAGVTNTVDGGLKDAKGAIETVGSDQVKLKSDNFVNLSFKIGIVVAIIWLIVGLAVSASTKCKGETDKDGQGKRVVCDNRYIVVFLVPLLIVIISIAWKVVTGAIRHTTYESDGRGGCGVGNEEHDIGIDDLV